MSPLTHDRRFIRELTRRAGAIALQRFHEGVTPEVKAGDEPVTAADREVNAFLVDALSERFPDDAILAEESEPDPRRFDADRTWMVDPIDGTREFIAGTDGWEVLIGLVVEGRPVLGVAYNPVTDTMLEASHGDGAYIHRGGQTATRFEVTGTDEDGLVVAVRAGRYHGIIQEMAEALSPVRVVEKGGFGARAALAAESEVDVVLHVGGTPREWDTCAIEAILVEAGAGVTTCLGERFDYLKEELVQPHGMVIATRDRLPAVLQEVTPRYRGWLDRRS